MSLSLSLAPIAAHLGSLARRFDIDLIDECGSTNADLLARAEAGSASGTVLVARRQTAGRGRRGRRWISAPDDSLTFSLFWRFAKGRSPAGLSLAAGLAVVRALAKDGAGNTATPGLKWPNDIVLDGRKLGGILVELLPGAAHAAVIGIGLNLRLPATLPDEVRHTAIAWPFAIDANVLLATVLGELHGVLQHFAAGGFAALQDEWLAHHVYQACPVRLLHDFAAPQNGLCRGVDVDGALLLEIDGRLERVLSGEVSLRGAA